MDEATPKSEWEQAGGLIRRDRRGRPVYVIRQQVNGKRYVRSTRAHTERAAFAHLKRFQADPEGYDPRGDVRPESIFLDATLARDFLTWSRDVQGNTPKWVHDQKMYLAWWEERLKGIDLRQGPRDNILRDRIHPALAGAAARPQRIAVLKKLYAWMREETHTISPTEDPTYGGALKVPPSRPAQWTRSKVIPPEHVQLAQEHLTGIWGACLTILAGTGWHVSELERFARSGAIEPLPRASKADGSVAVLVCPLTKGGETLRTRVSDDVRDAAERVRKHGSFDRSKLAKAVKAACAVVKRPDGGVGIPPIKIGSFRHSVATWAIDNGADPASVSAFLGHRSPRTTRKFYATHAAPAKVPTLT